MNGGPLEAGRFFSSTGQSGYARSIVTLAKGVLLGQIGMFAIAREVQPD